MIDIHSHILPGIDDGSADLDESLALAKLAVEDGIQHLIATPHHANGRYLNPSTQVRPMVESLNKAFQSENIPLVIHIGQEVRVYKDLIEDLQAGKLLTLAGSRYLLIELPTSRVPDDLNELLHELEVMDITAVIAHPERNIELANDLKKLESLVLRGALAQMTSHSINGLFGRKIQEISISMCKSNLVHFVSSDAHNVSQRAFGLKEAYSRITTKLDNSFTEYYRQNADKVLRNQTVEVINPSIVKKKHFIFW